MLVEEALSAWYKIGGIEIFSNADVIKSYLMSWRIPETEAEVYRKIISDKKFKGILEHPNEINTARLRNISKKIAKRENLNRQTVGQNLILILDIVGIEIKPSQKAYKKAGKIAVGVMKFSLAVVLIFYLFWVVIAFFDSLRILNVQSIVFDIVIGGILIVIIDLLLKSLKQ